MSNSTIDTEVLKEFSDNGIHDMFILANNTSEFEKSLELVKTLCLKMEKYNNSYVLMDNRNNLVKTSNKWNISGYKDILKSIELIERKFNELNSKIEILDPLISNIDTSRDEIEGNIDKIKDTLASEVVNKKTSDIIFNDKFIDRDTVVDSIENNFSANRDLTNSFNKELYNRVNQEIINLSNNRGN